MKRQTKPGRLTKALLETAHDMRRAGVMSAAAHEKITLRHLGDTAVASPDPITGYNALMPVNECATLREAINLVIQRFRG